jgi:autotransporter-associated beta strand protein
MNKTTVALLVPAVCLLTSQLSFAGSATWNSNPTSEYWDDDDNWTPSSHPNGPTDVATFDVSSRTFINLEAFPHDVEVDSVVFDSGASAYQITTNNSYWEQLDFTISGAGVINNSGVLQRFSISFVRYNADGYPSTISFKNNAAAGDLTGFIVGGSEGDETFAGVLTFNDTSSAGSSIIDNLGGRGWLLNGETNFRNSSSAASAVITNKTNFDGGGGEVWFYDTSNAGNSTIINNGNPLSGEDGGQTTIWSSADAAQSTIICNHGATGGLLRLWGDSKGGTARIELYGNGNLEMANHNSPGVTIGSLAGNGQVFLGANTLTIGSNNLSTTFSGNIQDTGAVVKIGPGNLTLSRPNSYSGGTTVSAGILLANNKNGSGTGSGPVQVLVGTFGGSGRVAGAVTVGIGNGAGAVLAPGARGVTPGTLSIQQTLTLNADSTYRVTFDSDVATADAVKAKGIGIQSAQILFNDLGTAVLPTGTVFTVINNAAATPISGIFANLADGATVRVGNNTFQANYGGGDGNDLTLTVTQ